MKIPVFLSYPQPHMMSQKLFIDRLKKYLLSRGFEPRTLGVTDYDMNAPLKAIRRLMLESNGIITIALRRTLVLAGKQKHLADIPRMTEKELQDVWFTSAYCQIEPAMAFQLGLPVLILREAGVIEGGLFEKGVLGTYMPEFSLESGEEDYLGTTEWNDIIGKREDFVRAVSENKGNPPKLY